MICFRREYRLESNYMKKTEKQILAKGSVYPVVVQEDISGGFWVSCPTIEGCYSQGETVEEALTNIKEAIELCLEGSKPAAKRSAQRAVSLHMVRV